MSIYAKEDSKYFHRCMQSIWDEQTLKPSEIVLVEDGQLTEELYALIQQWKDKLPNVLKIVFLDQNVGLGKALNIGLKECSYPIIARMDTDDIAHPKRFEIQTRFLQIYHEIDVVGSWVSEFNNSESNITSYRKLPQSHNKLTLFSKKRNPLNHPSVMYRKKAVLTAGSYLDMPSFEDYYLWVRMIQNNSKISNIPKVLVNMRGGKEQLKRRGGFTYLKNEILFQTKILHMNFISYTKYFQNISIRMLVRFIPNNLRGLIYIFIRKID